MKKIDIIISSKNNEESLFKTLTSLNDSIDKKKEKINVVIISNHSNKKTLKSIHKNTITYDMFKGIDVSSVILKKDTKMLDILKIGIEYELEKRVKADFLCFFKDEMIFAPNWTDHLLDEVTSFSNEFSLSAVAFRKNIFDKIKDFKTSMLSKNGESRYIESQIRSMNLSMTNKDDVISFDPCAKSDLIENEMQMKKSFGDKNVIYTFANDFSKLPKIKNRRDDFEYVCFTINSSKIQNDDFKIIDISSYAKELRIFDDEKISKEFVKLNPHLFFENNKISIWADTYYADSFDMNFFNEIIEKSQDRKFIALQDRNFKDPYQYLYQLRRNDLISSEKFVEILTLYKWYEIPLNIGMTDTNFLIRDHNDVAVRNVDEKTWNNVLKYKENDKIFFNMIFQINRLNIEII